MTASQVACVVGPSRRAARPAEEEIQETDTANQRRQASRRQTEFIAETLTLISEVNALSGFSCDGTAT